MINETNYAIERLPMPSQQGGRPRLYPYESLSVGETFFVPGKNTLNTGVWARRTGYRYTARRVSEQGVSGVRVWRIA